MVFPPVVPVGSENIVEDHRAEPENNEFSDVPDVERGEEAVGLDVLPGVG